MSASVGEGWMRPQLVPSHLRERAPKQTLRNRSSSTARLQLGMGEGRWPAGTRRGALQEIESA
eukprot:3928681-Alexandrium_andersonii.AAC.1